MLMYIVCLALGVAVGAMLAWHLWLVSKGQTSVENHDASHYKKVARKREGATVPSLRTYRSTDPPCRGIRQLLRPRSARES
jgi:hypothetical protein